MRATLYTALLAAATAAAAQKLPTGIQGFNSGDMKDNRDIKKKADFKDEFETAQKLFGSPGTFNSVRLYTMIQGGTDNDVIEAIEAAIETNTTMLLGLWCSRDEGIPNELDALSKAIEKYGDDFASLVVGISVGSEDLYRVSESGIENGSNPGKSVKEMLGYIAEVRDAIKGTGLAGKPVGHVDAWSAWANTSNSDVLDEVDFIGVDLYPYYEKDKGNSFDNTTDVFDYIYGQVVAVAGSKPIWVTETGHPSTGPDFGDSVASVDNAETYWQEIGCGKLFGRENVWWYNLRDSNPDNKEKFAITEDLNVVPRFNLSCNAEYVADGAPARINLDSAAAGVTGPKGAAVAGLVVGLAALLL